MAELVIKVAHPIASAERRIGPPLEGLESMPSAAAAAIDPLHQFLVSRDLVAAPFARRPARTTGLESVPLAPFAASGGEKGSGGTASELAKFLYVRDPPVERLLELQPQIAALPNVEACYVKPSAEVLLPRTTFATAEAVQGQANTPDFSIRQGYLDEAPGGVGWREHANRPGGGGEGIRLIDLEGEWNLEHESLAGVIDPALSAVANAATQWGDSRPTWRQHGTAVLAILAAKFGAPAAGVMGMAQRARVGVQSIFAGAEGKPSSAEAIVAAADRLSPGDVLVVELHRPGPRFTFMSRLDQAGNIAVEWWEDDFAAIKDATDRGVVVIEAAGNGAENLDSDIYDKSVGFTPRWKNPFRRENDSGAIVVGAGAVPSPSALDRSRLPFSNHGGVVDAQAWGDQVTTAGYGDLQGGPDRNHWFTNTFNGTSSALPIVAGLVVCLQGILKANGMPLLTPHRAREVLRSAGTPQQWNGNPGTDRIGNRPDLNALLAALGVPPVLVA